ncbi:AAA family ATPase [Mesobacillus zeae]|uniref:AAA family ATPase n=1 Tax=Mesobacillus zeae TaxID=1917180 RepID=UPI00300BCE64
MKVVEIKIGGIGGIDDLNIQFNPGLNLISGPNGVGKTTILDCISHSFSPYGSKTLRRNSRHHEGFWEIKVTNDEHIHTSRERRQYFHPHENQEHGQGTLPRVFAKKVVIFKSHRPLNYVPVNAISRDPDSDENSIAQQLIQETNNNDIKSWFLSRYLWSAHEGLLTQEQRENFELAKECFGIIDENVSFKNVNPSTHEILLNSFDKDIYFEYLSSGYMSVLILLLGLIKQIEYRFKEPTIKVKDFDGILLIDEADMHLHPQWQGKLVKVLKYVLPNAQIIATTHSPHMIQVAEPNEIIPLSLNEFQQVFVRELPNSKYGFQGWTIEEILTDVMGLSETNSDLYLSTLNDFERALSQDNLEEANKAFEVLNLMLHPKNPLRTLLKLQLATMGGEMN